MRSTTSRYAIAASMAAMAVSLPVLLHFIQNPGAKSPAPPIAFRKAPRQPVDKIAGDNRKLATAKPTTGMSSRGKDLDVRKAVQAEFAKRVRGSLTSTGDKTRNARTKLAMKKLDRQGGEPARLSTLVDQLGNRAAPGAGKNIVTHYNYNSGGGASFRSQGPAKRSSIEQSRHRLVARLARQQDTIPYPPGFKVRDTFEHVASNAIKQVSEHPVSTFSVDVDTASYSIMRRWLNQGRLPPKDAVRVEELVNYFSYGYARPGNASEPFKVTARVVPSPWNAEKQLVQIGIKGYELNNAERPRSNLVLLIDVSGSMQGSARLTLLKNAFKLLLGNMRPDDTVGIVTYASGSAVA